METIEIPKGDSYRIDIIVSGNNAPLNLSGYGLRFVAAQNYESTFKIADILVTGHDVFESGMTHIDITSGESNNCPGDYIYNLKLIDPSNGVTSFDGGIFRITPSL
jgi:hypothetical protein